MKINRRRMITTTATTAAVAGLGLGWHFQRQRQLRVGLIGCGMRGTQLAGLIAGTRWYDVCGRIVSVCDVHRTRAENVKSQYARDAEVTQDFRKVLEKKEIDAVFIATPDHWHVPCSLEALQAGKHVYCEKPMTLTIAEGQQLIKAVQDSGLTFQVGTQQRSFRQFQQACELVRSGRLGNLQRIEVTVPMNRSGGPFAKKPVPEALDWDRWLGPAPVVDYSDERFGTYRFFYDYSGGTLTDWGAHNIDIAHWAMDVDESGPIEISGEGVMPAVENGFTIPVEYEAEMKYANGVTLRVRPNPKEHGILIQGDEGRIYVSRKRLTGKPVEDLDKKPLPSGGISLTHRRSNSFYSYNTAHVLHFFDCIFDQTTPISNVISQHRSTSACHLANIAIRLGRTIRWNPDTEEVMDDSAATSMLSRAPRSIALRTAEK